jgi:hypothetical protein
MSHQSECREWMYMLFGNSNFMPAFQLSAFFIGIMPIYSENGKAKAQMTGMMVRGDRGHI